MFIFIHWTCMKCILKLNEGTLYTYSSFICEKCLYIYMYMYVKFIEKGICNFYLNCWMK